MKKKILVIDNQYSDFEMISQGVSSRNHEVYPKTLAQYGEVLDYVKIYLNPLYIPDRRELAMDKLINFIVTENIRMFIIDYKLSGNSEGLTGIDLVLKLNGELNLKERKACYLFLSRSSPTQESVSKKLSSLPRKVEWIEKGFSGFKMNDPGFLGEYLVSRIDEIYGASEFEIHLSNLDKLSAFSLSPKYKDKIEDLRKKAQSLNAIPAGHGDPIELCSRPGVEIEIIKKTLNNIVL